MLKIHILLSGLLLAASALADLSPLSDAALSEAAAAEGITVEAQTNGEIDVYYMDMDASPTALGGAIKVEGVQLVTTDGSGALDTSVLGAVTTRMDVDDTGSIRIAAEFSANSAIKVDAVRLGSSGEATNVGGALTYAPGAAEHFDFAYDNINGCTGCGGGLNIPQATSLGSLNLTNLTGTAVLRVRGH